MWSCDFWHADSFYTAFYKEGSCLLPAASTVCITGQVHAPCRCESGELIISQCFSAPFRDRAQSLHPCVMLIPPGIGATFSCSYTFPLILREGYLISSKVPFFSIDLCDIFFLFSIFSPVCIHCGFL